TIVSKTLDLSGTLPGATGLPNQRRARGRGSGGISFGCVAVALVLRPAHHLFEVVRGFLPMPLLDFVHREDNSLELALDRGLVVTIIDVDDRAVAQVGVRLDELGVLAREHLGNVGAEVVDVDTGRVVDNEISWHSERTS